MQTTRNFHMTDHAFLTFATVRFMRLENDFDAFAELDPTFTKEMLAEWKSRIEALKWASDDGEMITQQLITRDIKQQIAAAKKAYNLLIIYVKRAFPKDKETLIRFGKDKFREVQRYEYMMADFLLSVSKEAESEEAKLLQVGTKPEHIQSLGNIAKELAALQDARQEQMTTRKLRTQDRVQSLNTLWAKLHEICALAEIIFTETKPEKLVTYQMPKRKRPKPIEVKPESKVVMDIRDETPETELILHNESNTPLIAFVSEDSNASIPDNTLKLAARQSIRFAVKAISDGTYGFLILQNSHKKKKAAFLLGKRRGFLWEIMNDEG